MKIIVSASPVLCPPREAITWKSLYAKQLAKIDSCDRIIYSNIARCNTNVTSCALFGSIYGDFYLQGMPLAISFIVHQFHNRPIEGLLHQFMSIMESRNPDIYCPPNLRRFDKRGLPWTGKRGIGLKGTVRPSGLCVGGLWTWGGSQFLRVRGSVDETISIWETGRGWQWEEGDKRLKVVPMIPELSTYSRYKFVSSNNFIQQGGVFFVLFLFFKSKNRKFKQKPSNPSQLNNIAVPERKQWKWVLQGFQP